MHRSDYTTGYWSRCSRRYWCNGGFLSSISDELRLAFKQFNCSTWERDDTYNWSLHTVSDYFALPAEKEVWGTDPETSGQLWSPAKEQAVLTVFAYYETRSNITKYRGSGINSWYERSTGTMTDGNGPHFCYCYYNRSQEFYVPNDMRYNETMLNNQGISPFGVM